MVTYVYICPNIANLGLCCVCFHFTGLIFFLDVTHHVPSPLPDMLSLIPLAAAETHPVCELGSHEPKKGILLWQAVKYYIGADGLQWSSFSMMLRIHWSATILKPIILMLVYNNVTMFQWLCDWYMLFVSYIWCQLSVSLHWKNVMYITSVLMHAQSST